MSGFQLGKFAVDFGHLLLEIQIGTRPGGLGNAHEDFLHHGGRGPRGVSRGGSRGGDQHGRGAQAQTEFTTG